MLFLFVACRSTRYSVDHKQLLNRNLFFQAEIKILNQKKNK